MLKERFQLKIQPIHVLTILFLFFITYVGIAAFPQFIINSGMAFHEQQSLRSYIKTTNDQYSGMLETESELSFLHNKGTYIDLNGLMADALGQPMMNDRVKLKNGHLAKVIPETTDYADIQQAAGNIIRLHNAHTLSGGKFLFVMVSSQISRYEDLLPVGYTDTTNESADVFLSLLEEAGVPYLDLREELQKDGMSVANAYYVTDHHWTPQTGFWAYGKMVKKLAQMGAIEPVDPFYTDPGNYTFETHPNTFLGSSGKRTGKYYAGLDDSVIIRPNFETDITVQIPLREMKLQGRYEDVSYNTDAERNYDRPAFYDENVYGLYGWGDMPITHWRNENAPQQGKFLLIGESFGNIPFSLMSIVFSSCDEMDMRHYEEDFAAYYDSYKPDTVILAFNVDNVISEFTDDVYLG